MGGPFFEGPLHAGLLLQVDLRPIAHCLVCFWVCSKVSLEPQWEFPGCVRVCSNVMFFLSDEGQTQTQTRTTNTFTSRPWRLNPRVVQIRLRVRFLHGASPSSSALLSGEVPVRLQSNLMPRQASRFFTWRPCWHNATSLPHASTNTCAQISLSCLHLTWRFKTCQLCGNVMRAPQITPQLLQFAPFQAAPGPLAYPSTD